MYGDKLDSQLSISLFDDASKPSKVEAASNRAELTQVDDIICIHSVTYKRSGSLQENKKGTVKATGR